MIQVFQFLGVSTEFVSNAKLKGIDDLLIFGPAIAQSNFKFDQKLHQSVYKNRRQLPKDSWPIKMIAKAIASMPAKIRPHTEKILYRPFSKKVPRPTLDSEMRSRILDYLDEDISRLENYTKQDFSAWRR